MSGSNKGPTKQGKWVKTLRNGGLVLLALVVLLAGRNWILGYNDPGVKLMHGTVRALQDKNPEFQLTLSLEDVDKEYRFLEDMELQVAGGIKGDKISSMLHIKNGRHDYAEAVMSIQGDNVFFDLEDLYKDILYVELGSDANNLEDALVFLDYLKDLNIKGVKWKNYGKIFTEEMGSNIDKKGSDIILTLDIEDLCHAFEAMIDEAEDDRDLKEGLKNALIKMFEKMEKDDVTLMTLMSSSSDAITGIEDNWDELYEDLMDNLRSLVQYESDQEYDYYSYYSQSPLAALEDTPIDGQELRFSFFLGKLTKVETLVDMGDMDLSLELKLNKGYKAKTYKTSKAELLDDMDSKEVANMSSSIMKQVFKNIEEDKDFVEGLEDTRFFKFIKQMIGIKGLDDLFDRIEDGDLDELMYLLPYGFSTRF